MRRAAAIACVTALAALANGCGGGDDSGGVDTDALAAAVYDVANEDVNLRDDFQQVSDCVAKEGSIYECSVTGDDGEQFIDVEVLDDGTFRVDEPEINVAFSGTIDGSSSESDDSALGSPVGE